MLLCITIIGILSGRQHFKLMSSPLPTATASGYCTALETKTDRHDKNTIFMAVALAPCGLRTERRKRAGDRADRDGHDCIGSAGHQWSEARKDCIRPSEDGVKMLPTTQLIRAPYMPLASTSHSAQAELFPATKTEVLDRRDLPGGGQVNEQVCRGRRFTDDTKNVRQADGHWVTYRRNSAAIRMT